MFSKFFINRPIFATVLSLIIVLAGLAALRVLPISRYPEISPPVVNVTAIYPGASAEVIERTVAAPIEEQITGVENMLYMDSVSSADGARCRSRGSAESSRRGQFSTSKRRAISMHPTDVTALRVTIGSA